MAEESTRTLGINELPDTDKEYIVRLLKDEGRSDDYIQRVQLIERTLKNPRGLNQILSDIQGLLINEDDWHKNISKNMYMGRLSDKQAKGRMRQLWGTILEEHAFLYLEKKLKPLGWNLRHGQRIDGREYDCLGWKACQKIIQDPDLAVEMYFPRPRRTTENTDLSYIIKHPKGMREKLGEINAEYKYILIGVPPNKEFTIREIAHSDMKVVYQRYTWSKLVLRKQKMLSHE